MNVHALGAIPEPSDEGAQNGRVQPERLVSMILPPSFKARAVRQGEAFEKFTPKNRHKRFQGFGIHDAKVDASKGCCAPDVQVNPLEAEGNRIVVCM